MKFCTPVSGRTKTIARTIRAAILIPVLWASQGQTLSQQPDLTVSGVQAPATAAPEEGITVKWTTSNIGTAPTGSDLHFSGVYFSTDTILDIDTDEYLGGTIHFDTLSPGESSQDSAVGYIPIGASGPYYIFVYTDDVDFIAELNENNNTARSQVITISNDAPDLQVTAVQAPSTAASGQEIQIVYSITNAGTDAINGGSWFDYVYLSPDTIFDDGNDQLVGTAMRDTSLPAGETLTDTLDATLPTGLGGYYYVIVHTNPFGGVFESNYENNTGRSAPVAIDLLRPDLIVSDLVVSDSVLFGEKLHYSYQLTNQGDTSTQSQSWSDFIYFTSDSVVATDTLLAVKFVTQNILPGASIWVQDSVAPPSGLMKGRYHIVVTADAIDQINELVDTNNSRISAAFLYGFEGPDLEVPQVQAPSTGFSGQNIQVDWIVENTGTLPTSSPAWYDRIFLSPVPVFDSAQVIALDYAENFSYLGVGESYANTKLVKLPEGISGSYYIFVAADGYLAVGELSEANNITRSDSAITITLSPSPDLTVTSLTVPSQAFSRDTITVSYTVTNAGGAGTVSTIWYDRIFLSAETTLNVATATLLRYIQHQGNLQPDSAYSGAVQVELPHAISGPHYIYVQTDVFNSVYEHVGESNNTRRSDSLAISLTPPPDLVVSAIAKPATGNSGQPIAVTWTVENQGFTRPYESAWYDRLYVSHLPTFIPESSAVIGTFPNPGIPEPDSSYTQSQNAVLPDGISGPYYVYVMTDFRGDVFENLFENNNVTRSAAEVQIALTPWADLQVAGAVFPSSATAGQQATISWTVGNGGPGAVVAPLWKDAIYVSSSPVWDSTLATLLKEISQAPPLGPAGSRAQTATVTLPAAISGTHYFYIRLDAGNAVYENAGEGDNIVRSDSVIVQPYPPVDLAVMAVIAPSAAPSGTEVTVDWIVQNVGAAKTLVATWQDAVYVSLDTVLNPVQDSLMKVVWRQGALEAGASYQQSIAVKVPNGILGNYYCLVRTDTGAQVAESNLANNIRAALSAISVTLTPPPDLRADSLTLDEPPAAGQPVMARWTVTNAGPGSTGSASWFDAVILSTDDVIDNSDTRLAAVSHDLPVGPGSFYQDSAEITIPSYVSGAVYLILETDSRNLVYELGLEVNNTLWQPVTVNVLPPSDLVVVEVTPPDSATAGEEVTIDWIIRNDGVNPATGFVTDAVYISADSIWQVTDPLFGTERRRIDLAPGAEARLTMKGSLLSALLADSNGSVAAPVPGFPPGDYYVIARTDIRNNIPESNDANNGLASSATMRIETTPLVLGVPTPGTVAQGQSLYYSIAVPAGQTLKVHFDADAAAGSIEMYVRFGNVPTLSNFDIAYGNPLFPDQTISVPETQGGTYYILVRGDHLPSGPVNFTILAELKTFSISGVVPPRGGNTGEVTISVDGARFVNGSTVKLVGPGGESPRVIRTRFIDATRIDATFAMTDTLPLAAYDVVVTRPDSSQTTLADGFTLEPGTPMSANLGFAPPRAILRGGAGLYSITIQNTANIDLPFLIAHTIIPAGQPFTITSSTMQSISDAIPESVRAVATTQDYFDFGAWRFIPMTARSVRAGELLSYTLRVTGVQGDEFPIQIAVDALSREEFIQAQLLYIELLRQAVLGGGGEMLGLEFQQLAANPAAFTDLLMQTYVDLGILEQEDIASVTSAAVQSAVMKAAAMRDNPAMMEYLLAMEMTDCQSLLTWGNIALSLGLITIGVITGALLAPVTLGVSAVMAVVGGAALGFNIGSVIMDQPGILGRIFCNDDPRTPTPVVGSMDPNDINGPAGYGDRRWVAVDQRLHYTIRFENDPKLATAPAQVVTISLPLDSTVDPRSFRLGNYGFGRYVFDGAENRPHYVNRHDVTDSLGVYVDVTAGFDVGANRAFWTFRSVNPSTGELPSNPLSGFLPVNDTTHRGEGFVTFSIRPKDTSKTGDLIVEKARIVFDANEAIDTPPTTNTIDAGLPSSNVRLLPANTDSAAFLVRWGGQDDSTGSGLKHFTVFVSVNTGPYAPWKENTTDTSATYSGISGNQYRFYSIASDNAGNVEPGKSSADASTLVTGVEEYRPGIPKEFVLHQNYPNPFNPATTLRYDLPEAARVELIVYNLLGQKLATLVNEIQEPGYKSAVLDASGLPSGVYFYEIRMGNFTAVRKMMLIR